VLSILGFDAIIFLLLAKLKDLKLFADTDR